MDIDNFRWILAGLGVVLVAGIYIRERIRYRPRVDPKGQTVNQPEPEGDKIALRATPGKSEESLELPSIRNDPLEAILTDRGSLATEPEIEETVVGPNDEPSKSDDPFGIVQIKVAAHDGMCFSGKLLINALSSAGLEYGTMNIFHKQSGGSQLPLFSVVNMVEPGSFPIDQTDHFESPGVVFFLQVATSNQPLNDFDEMLRTVHVLAARVGGEIRDSENNLLTVEKTESIRESLELVTG